ncbi:RidA family protein [Hoeflea sp. TYP-13]|uniref:RidA family protein n=1 Tax=Hoeflea sp. TYP-13 TaxID=3230023 RepID=UPI0034C5F9F4
MSLSTNNTVKIVPASQQHTTAGPYSPVLEIKAGSLVVISGQVAIKDDGSLFAEDIEEQSRHTLMNCERQLAAADCGFADVFKVNVYLTDLKNWPAFNEVYRKVMPDPLPVRTAVQAALLENFLVEIEMWAAKP